MNDFSEASGYQLVGIRDHARAILSLLDRHEKKRLVWIFLISLFSIALDVLSLGLVIPVIALLSGSNLATRIREVIPMFENFSEFQFVGTVMVVLTITYGLKNLFLLFATYTQNQFNADVSTRLSQSLLKTYFAQPYEFFLSTNSALLIRNINNASVAITGGVKPFMFLFSDLLVGVGVIGVLLIVEPIGGLAAIAVFGIAGYVFQRVTRSRVRQLGLNKQRFEGAVLKDVMQGAGAIKELKILGRDQLFLSQHLFDRQNYGDTQSRYATMQAIPRLWLETLAVLCLSILVTFIVLQGRAVSEALPVIGLFAAAAFRVLPSVNRIIASIQDLQYSRPIVGLLRHDFGLPCVEQSESNVRVDRFETLELLSVDFTYRGSLRKSLSGVNLLVSRGEAIGIVGASGAGKSTLVDLVLGLLDAQSGLVKVNGELLSTVRRGWQDIVGYVPQHIFLADDSIKRNVALGISDEEIDEKRVWSALTAAQISDFVRSLPEGMDTMLGEHGSRISGGQRQRIGIARALYHDPQVLILDEATSSLDVETERDVMEAVEALHGSKTVIIVSHRYSTVEYCNRLYAFSDGVVVREGEPKSVLQVNEG